MQYIIFGGGEASKYGTYVCCGVRCGLCTLEIDIFSVLSPSLQSVRARVCELCEIKCGRTRLKFPFICGAHMAAR